MVIRPRRYLHWERRIGRVFVWANPWAINRPLVSFYSEQESVAITLGWGNGISDPALSVSVDLDRTLLGRALSEVYWRVVVPRQERDAPVRPVEGADSTDAETPPPGPP